MSVEHPPHYNMGRIEVLDAIEDWNLGYDKGNVIKYVARSAYKGRELEDLRKGLFFLKRAIQRLTHPGLTSKQADAAEASREARYVATLQQIAAWCVEHHQLEECRLTPTTFSCLARQALAG